jgi:hypothetical protein
LRPNDRLITLFHISVDQFLFPNTGGGKTTRRRQLDNQLNGLKGTDLIILPAIIKELREAKGTEE